MTKQERLFVHLSICFSVIHALGYLWLGLQQGFTICIIAMIVLDLLYIPSVLIKSVKLFPFYLFMFSLCLVYITAFVNSKLFNNYSALLCLFVAILIKPKYKNVFMGIYLFVAASAFCIAGDEVYFLIIHASRSLWIFTIYDFVIYGMYTRKPVILFEEEIQILEQIADDKQMKEIELNGMSDRTIRRRIESACKRNGLKDKDELKDLYLQTYKKD